LAQIDNFIERYLDFFSGTEPPTIFNRWCIIGGIGALLGRNCWIQHGHKKIYPNQYIMLVGESGTRKSTALKVFLKPLLEAAGYTTIAANKTSKEKFLVDFEEGMDKINDPEEHLDVRKNIHNGARRSHNPTMRELFGIKDSRESSECLILSDDANVFLGHSNIEFIELITDLWDYEGVYSSRTKTGKSVHVPNPTLSALFGNTQIGISMSFPLEVIGQGLFSRLIAVHSDPSGRRITFPKPPSQEIKKGLIEDLIKIRAETKGEIGIDPYATIALDEIYQEWKELTDVRFKSYSQRRFDHLLKLCMCCAAARRTRYIDRKIVTYANTILHYTESFMPKALGEFGKARHSDVSAKILEILEKADAPVELEQLIKLMHRDVESTKELANILGELKSADKIQATRGGFLPKKEIQRFDFPYCTITLLREYLEDKAKTGLPI